MVHGSGGRMKNLEINVCFFKKIGDMSLVKRMVL